MHDVDDYLAGHRAPSAPPAPLLLIKAVHGAQRRYVWRWQVGALALKINMQALGPLVLPYSELVKYGANMLVRKVAKGNKAVSRAVPQSWLQPYVPDFRRAFDFFCIHTGGRGIIDGLEKEMTLTRRQVEPSRASLYRFGNTSSTSIW